MGKPNGFLEYERQENKRISPSERIKNFDEFYKYCDVEKRRRQAARCMDCGVPFCQSAMTLSGMVVGCPLHNLIPEWNDAIYHGQDDHAYERLKQTNPFPEFTGRVCPALCEKACINGCDLDPVTVHDDELYIIETAYERGYVTPHIPEIKSGRHIAVVGSGPSGLAAADALINRGHDVTVYERDDHIGGLLMYGIPNMKLDKSVIDRRKDIMQSQGVVFKTGVDVGVDEDVKKLAKRYDALLLCCGAKKPRPLDIEDVEDIKGIRYAVDFLTDVTKGVIKGKLPAPLIKQVKDKHIVVVGGGDTGNDCIATAIRMGAKSVTALEMMPKPPLTRKEDNPWPEWPKTLRTDYGHEEAIDKYGTDPRVYETTVEKVIPDGRGHIKEITTVNVEFKDQKIVRVKGTEKNIKCDLLLIAAGFIGAEDYLPDALGLPRTKRGTIQTKGDGYYTGKGNIFSAGDMRRGQSLVVWAISEGRACAAEVDEYLMGYSNMI